jgi:FkbM family methyltransferase
MFRKQLARLISHNRAWLLIQTRVVRDSSKLPFQMWLLENPREECRYDYDLTAQSVVLDIGGYRGEWAEEMVRRYNPYVHVFEPMPSFAQELARQFRSNPKLRVHCFGLGDSSEEKFISELENASSTYVSSDNMVVAKFRDISDVVQELGVTEVDLAKINIEGGEYPLLARMIETGVVRLFRNLQIQFHDFVPGAEERYEAIRTALGETHSLTYHYRFVWENWRRRAA